MHNDGLERLSEENRAITDIRKRVNFMNKVILKGRLAKDVELRRTPTDKAVATVSIAVDRWGKDKQADFIPLVVWGTRAESFAKYLGKGKEVLVEGKIQVRNYDDQNGNKRYVTEVLVDNFYFCGSAGGNNGNGGSNQNTGGMSDGYFGAEGYAEDIPF